MKVTINGVPIADDQEQLFQDVKESFRKFIDNYRRKHWLKDFIYWLYCYLTEESKAEKAYRAWLRETDQVDKEEGESWILRKSKK